MLALQRAYDRDVAPGLWEVVAGRLRPGEDPRFGLQREIAEEAGLHLDIDEIPQSPIDAYAARRGDEPMVVLVYRVEVGVGAEPRLSAEHVASDWLDADALLARGAPARLVEAVRRALG